MQAQGPRHWENELRLLAFPLREGGIPAANEAEAKVDPTRRKEAKSCKAIGGAVREMARQQACVCGWAGGRKAVRFKQRPSSVPVYFVHFCQMCIHLSREGGRSWWIFWALFLFLFLSLLSLSIALAFLLRSPREQAYPTACPREAVDEQKESDVWAGWGEQTRECERGAVGCQEEVGWRAFLQRDRMRAG